MKQEQVLNLEAKHRESQTYKACIRPNRNKVCTGGPNHEASTPKSSSKHRSQTYSVYTGFEHKARTGPKCKVCAGNHKAWWITSINHEQVPPKKQKTKQTACTGPKHKASNAPNTKHAGSQT